MQLTNLPVAASKTKAGWFWPLAMTCSCGVPWFTTWECAATLAAPRARMTALLSTAASPMGREWRFMLWTSFCAETCCPGSMGFVASLRRAEHAAKRCIPHHLPLPLGRHTALQPGLRPTR